MEVLAFIVIFLVVFCTWYYRNYHERYSLARKLPGLPAWPIIGNAHNFLGVSPSKLLKRLEENIKIHGQTVRFMLGPVVVVFLGDPVDVEAVLGSQKLIDKSEEYEFIGEWLGTGLLTSTGQKWHSRRKVITPTFHFKILEQFVEVFNKHSEIFVKNLEQFKGQECDVFPLIGLCALDVICGTLKLSYQQALGSQIFFFVNRNGHGS